MLEEHQTVIYLAPKSVGQAGARPIQAQATAPPEGDGRPFALVRRLDFGPALLFRFSAATWNAHRIHYDRPFATDTEGYEGLVVHGPLLTMLLALETERILGGLADLEFRATSPVVDTEALDVFVCRTDERTCEAQARKLDGTLAASARGTAGGQKGRGTGNDDRGGRRP